MWETSNVENQLVEVAESPLKTTYTQRNEQTKYFIGRTFAISK